MADVRDSFRKVAANYTKSTFHASAVRLQEVVDLVRPKKGDLALDVATGTGNTALALTAARSWSMPDRGDRCAWTPASARSPTSTG